MRYSFTRIKIVATNILANPPNDVNERRQQKASAAALRAMEGKRLRLHVVNGYAAAWEER